MVKFIRTSVLHIIVRGVKPMLNNEHTLTSSNTHTQDELKEDYITKIVKLLSLCNDISLLDLIKKLLEKSI